MKASYLWRGLPGHPLHPPLTDAAIGAYTAATVLAFLDVLGLVDEAAAKGWWLALVVALVVTVPTAATGFADWLTITPRTPLWRTATAHMAANLIAGVLFLVSAVVGYDGYLAGDVTAAAFVLTLLGFAVLTLGGWLGGTIVFVHGMRVLNLVDEPAARAASPLAEPEKREADAD
ncbi:MAG: DUF2231 domain-containing protein [Thermoleophilia bacterium]|nr:DUF2231 domain-containing protein [Thermoleophilia bacterium]